MFSTSIGTPQHLRYSESNIEFASNRRYNVSMDNLTLCDPVLASTKVADMESPA